MTARLTYVQESLFKAPPLVVASREMAPGNVYAAHFEQRTGPAMWKLGYTEAYPPHRAKQIACVLVTWWPGSMLDERKVHRQWKHHRVSKASEFFYHGDDIDRWILRMIRQQQNGRVVSQLATFSEIMLRLRLPGSDYGEAA